MIDYEAAERFANTAAQTGRIGTAMMVGDLLARCLELEASECRALRSIAKMTEQAEEVENALGLPVGEKHEDIVKRARELVDEVMAAREVVEAARDLTLECGYCGRKGFEPRDPDIGPCPECSEFVESLARYDEAKEKEKRG